MNTIPSYVTNLTKQNYLLLVKNFDLSDIIFYNLQGASTKSFHILAKMFFLEPNPNLMKLWVICTYTFFVSFLGKADALLSLN